MLPHAEMIPNNRRTPDRSALHIGFVSTRFSGTDGVSLETAKWAEVLEQMGHTCFYFCGLSDRPPERSLVVEEAFYRHPEVRARHQQFWGHSRRKSADTVWIHKMREHMRAQLDEFVRRFAIDVLIPENVLAIPLHIPLGLALTELIAETGLPTIAHHHDFTWERKRFLVNGVWDYISMAFPPHLPSVHHVVINSSARHQLARRKGVGSAVIPNVMNFERPAPQPDAYSADIRETLGLDPDELFVLQPTRVVARKGIEQAIELVHRLERKACLVISHATGDEGDEYAQRVREYAQLLGVKIVFASGFFAQQRGRDRAGRKVYSLWDAYPFADLVTYPSVFEGFGNAFLEALYFKRPIVVNNYSIFSIDIRPKGFQVIEFDEYITDATMRRVREILGDPEKEAAICRHNYGLALQHFSYTVLRHKLRIQLENCFGVNGQ